MDDDRLLDVLGNEHARAVLAATVGGPRSVEEIAARTDASQPTVYRQVDALLSLGLVEERRGLEDGTHYRTYEAAVAKIELELTSDGFEVQLRSETIP